MSLAITNSVQIYWTYQQKTRTMSAHFQRNVTKSYSDSNIFVYRNDRWVPAWSFEAVAFQVFKDCIRQGTRYILPRSIQYKDPTRRVSVSIVQDDHVVPIRTYVIRRHFDSYDEIAKMPIFDFSTIQMYLIEYKAWVDAPHRLRRAYADFVFGINRPVIVKPEQKLEDDDDDILVMGYASSNNVIHENHILPKALAVPYSFRLEHYMNERRRVPVTDNVEYQRFYSSLSHVLTAQKSETKHQLGQIIQSDTSICNEFRHRVMSFHDASEQLPELTKMCMNCSRVYHDREMVTRNTCGHPICQLCKDDLQVTLAANTPITNNHKKHNVTCPLCRSS